MTDINELLERVKKATRPDRHLDALIEVEARRQEAYRAGLNDQQRAYWTATVDGLVYDNATRYDAAKITASIDAALAVVERVLPEGWEIDMGTCGEKDMPWACLTEPDEPCRDFSANAPTMELAIVEALLSAVIAIGDQS